MSAAQVKELRDRTGAGIMDSKRALEEAGGDVEKARKILRKQGLAVADKKSGRTAAEGLVYSYIHGNGRYGALIEINCETDFVARTEDFQQLARDVALQVVGAATPPRYVTNDEVSAEDLEAGVKEFGDEKTFRENAVLMEQPFIKQPGVTVEQLVREVIGKVGENIVVRRFTRYALGETQTEETGAGA